MTDDISLIASALESFESSDIDDNDRYLSYLLRNSLMESDTPSSLANNECLSVKNIILAAITHYMTISDDVRLPRMWSLFFE